MQGAPGDGIDERYVDPAAVVDAHYGGTWLAAFAPVAGTDFIVGAQRRYTVRSAIGGWAVVGALGLMILGIALWRRARRRARRRAD